MAVRAEATSLAGVLEQLAAWGLCTAAAMAFLAAAFLLLFRVPAKTVVIFDGAKAYRRSLRGAIVLNGVHNAEQPIYPRSVEDMVQFTTREGQEIRATVRRGYWSGPASLIWYAPADPRHVTARSPLRCVGFAVLCIVTAVWLRW